MPNFNVYREKEKELEVLGVDSFVEKTLPKNLGSPEFAMPEYSKAEIDEMVGHIKGWLDDWRIRPHLERLSYRHQALSVIGDEKIEIKPEEIYKLLGGGKLDTPELDNDGKDRVMILSALPALLTLIIMFFADGKLANMFVSAVDMLDSSPPNILLLIPILTYITTYRITKNHMLTRPEKMPAGSQDIVSVLATITYLYKQILSEKVTQEEKFKCLQKLKIYLAFADQLFKGQKNVFVEQMNVRISLDAALKRKSAPCEQSATEEHTEEVDASVENTNARIESVKARIDLSEPAPDHISALAGTFETEEQQELTAQEVQYKTA